MTKQSEISPAIRRAIMRYASRESLPFIEATEYIFMEGLKVVMTENKQSSAAVDKPVDKRMHKPLNNFTDF